MREFIVKKKITIKASAEDVWKALTRPELTKKYFFNCRVLSSWKVGESITFKGRVLWIKKIEMRGKILELVPEKTLKYTLQNSNTDNMESFSTITDELRHHNGETSISITDDVGQGPGAEKRYKRSLKGWDKVLKGLKAMLEEDTVAVASTH